MKLRDIFSENQIDSIRNIIKRQCQRHQQREMYFQDLCYTPYAGNRSEHSITYSVLSGFREETVIEGITISVEQYGLHDKMAQPVLSSNNVIAHILNSGCGFTSKPFKENCKFYNKKINEGIIYVCIVFTASDDGILDDISIKVPNENGIFIEDYVFNIYSFSSSNAGIA